MRVRVFLGALCVIGVCWNWVAAGQENEQAPRLLLTPQRLRRLQRDRERQTVRWQNFEKRVQTVPDSPERGFELALYYAVTRDEARGREAVTWATAHLCEQRQVALVADWAGELAPDGLKTKLGSCPSIGTGRRPSGEIFARNVLFSQVALEHVDTNQLDSMNKRVLGELDLNRLEPSELYAAVEYLITIRSVTRTDLRQQNAPFFSQLPKQLLLSLRPEQIEHPDWMSHIAALAFVALDPNLENSQFLQGWAMEDRQMLREGSGVAYEFLWADPYLPGIAYQNMEPWVYNPNGTLFARATWEPNTCWVKITARGSTQEACSPNNTGNGSFGTLTLSKVSAPCMNVPSRKNNESTILWGFKPNAPLTFDHANGKTAAAADPAGMWSVPNEEAGKVCTGKHDHL